MGKVDRQLEGKNLNSTEHTKRASASSLVRKVAKIANGSLNADTYSIINKSVIRSNGSSAKNVLLAEDLS